MYVNIFKIRHKTNYQKSLYVYRLKLQILWDVQCITGVSGVQTAIATVKSFSLQVRLRKCEKRLPASLCLSVCLSVYPFACLSACLSVRLLVCPFACLSVCLSVSLCLSVCHSLCLPTFINVFSHPNSLKIRLITSIHIPTAPMFPIFPSAYLTYPACFILKNLIKLYVNKSKLRSGISSLNR